MTTDVRDLIIIGGGPAGYTAAIYAARANLKPLVLAGYAPGGQLMTTTDIENFPGFPEGVPGPDLMENMRKQVERFGAEILFKDAANVSFEKRPFAVTYEDTIAHAHAVIIATGAAPRKLGIPAEETYWAKGVSSCATCDGAFFRGKEVAVIGGGDSAMEEANFLTRFATKVTLIHRREEFRASKIMIERAQKNPKIAWALNKTISDISGNGKVEALTLTDTRTGEASTVKMDGLFLAIGHIPNSKLFAGALKMDDEGYLLADEETRTSAPGVFACGDVVDHVFRQAITAAGTGCRAAISAERFIASL